MSEELIFEQSEDEAPVLESFDDIVYSDLQAIDPDDIPDEVHVERNPFVLGKVRGPFFGPVGVLNGNGRIYLPTVPTQGIIDSPYTKQMMNNKTLLGECHHPGDKRGSVWLDEACISITKLWMEGNMLYGEADILDTPKGRIVWSLVKYGSKLGVSARAGGKGVRGTYMGQKGDIIKPENYDFKTFDVVLNPGFAPARPTFTAEEGESMDAVCSEGLHDELMNLLSEGKVDKGLLRCYIDYCEDESLKDLLPMLEETATDCSEDTSLNAELQNLSEENERLAKECQRLSQLADALREECMSNDSGSAAEVVEELINNGLCSLSKNYLYEDQVNELMELSEDFKKQNFEMQSKLSAYERHFEELEQSRDAYAEDLATLTEDYGVLEQKYNTLYEENCGLKNQVSNLMQRSKGLEEELTEFQEHEEARLAALEEERVKREQPKLKIRNKVDLSASIVECTTGEPATLSEESVKRRALIDSI